MMMTVVIGIEKAMMMVMMLTTMSIARGPPHHHPPRESNICQLSVWASVTLAMEIMGNHPIVSSTNTCLTFQLSFWMWQLSIAMFCSCWEVACPPLLQRKQAPLAPPAGDWSTHLLTRCLAPAPPQAFSASSPLPASRLIGAGLARLLEGKRPTSDATRSYSASATATTASKDTPLPPLQTLGSGACMCERFWLYLCLCVTTYTRSWVFCLIIYESYKGTPSP